MSEQMTRDGALAFVIERTDELRLFVDGKPTRSMDLHAIQDPETGVRDVSANIDGRGVVVRGYGWEEKFTWREVTKAIEAAAAERHRAYARAAMAEIAAKRGDAA